MHRSRALCEEVLRAWPEDRSQGTLVLRFRDKQGGATLARGGWGGHDGALLIDDKHVNLNLPRVVAALLQATRPERQLAALLLLAGGDSGLAEAVLARYLAGELGDAPPPGLALSARRARALSERAATERDGATQRRVLHALGAAQESATIPGILTLFQRGEEPTHAQARALLRAQPTQAAGKRGYCSAASCGPSRLHHRPRIGC